MGLPDSVRSYSRKPATVEAAQITADNLDEIAAWCSGYVDGSTIQIDDGDRGYGGYAHPGDWVVRWPGGFVVYPDQEDGWSVGFHDEFEPAEGGEVHQ